MAQITIVSATNDDAAGIANLYAWHVLHGTATFETEPPDAAEVAARMAKVGAACLPWLVARDEAGSLLGFAYAGPYHARAAYRFTCENSIYVAHDRRGEGIGKALLAALLPACEAAGYRQMIALIAASEPASIALHRTFGFTDAGRIAAVGRKHGIWLDVVHMQRALGEGAATPPKLEP